MNEPVRSGRGRARRAPDRATTLDTAADLFAARGYRNTTMQDLADELGIAKPTLYVHAKTKVDILEGIFERLISDADARLKEIEQSSELPDEQLRQVIRYWSGVAISTRSNMRVYISDERELPGRVARYFRRWSADLAARIRDIIADGQRRGIFDPSLDPTSTTFGIVGACVWASQWFSPSGTLSPEAVADDLCHLLLRGIVIPSEGDRVDPAHA